MSRYHMPGRRDWLKTTAFAGLGLGLPAGTTRAARPPEASRGRIRSCILVFFYGGPSHLDTFDPKPDAPAEVRGEYRTIATAVPGVRVCEHLPRIARLMDRLALVRGLHHPMRNHNSAAAEALTGRTPAGGDQELLTDDPRGLPTLGSAVSYALGPRAHVLPYVALPYTLYNVVQLPGQTPGLLGGAYDRFQVDGDPSAPTSASPAFDGTADLSGRAALLRRLDRAALPGPAARAEAYRDRALRLLGVAGGAPPVRPVEGAGAAARALRPAPARPEPAAGPPAGGGRRQLRRGLRRPDQRPGRQLGQPREALRAAPPAHPAERPGVLGPDRGPGGPRPAGIDAGGGDGRVRPHAEDQRQRRPRPLARLLHGGAGRRRRERRRRARGQRQDRRVPGRATR